MEVKPGYKQTEVGVIPVEWEAKRLGQMAELTSSKRIFESDYVPFGIPFYRGKEISMLVDGEVIDDVCYISEVRFAAIKAKFGAPVRGDILITAVGTLANVYVVNSDEPFYFKDGNLIWLRGITDVEAPFLGIQLRRARNAILDGAIGTSQKALTIVVLRDVTVAIPPLPEQRAIATALSDVDGLLGGLDRLIAKKRDLKQAAMQQLLTGQTRLPGFHGEWEVKRVPEVCWFQEGPGVRNTQFTSTGVKLLNGTNIFRGRINLDTTDRFISDAEAHGAYAHFLADSGDIVIACSGISVEKFHEKVAVVNPAHLPFCMNTSTMRFKPRQEHLVRDYFCHFLMGDSFKRQIAPQATGSAQLNFGPSHVEKVELPLPPHPEQTAIASVLTEMDGELAVLEQRREKTRALKQAMMQELLTGRTRLI